MATMLTITAGPYRFRSRLEEAISPLTCAAFLKVLPFRSSLIQARWSGEAGWIPLGDFDLGVGAENATSEPTAGALLFHPAGISETEILFPYGTTRFASVEGPLSGNHFLTIVGGREHLPELGRLLCWQGAQDITFEV